MNNCPTCGSLVRVIFADEGTSHYEPISPSDGLRERRIEAAAWAVVRNELDERDQVLEVDGPELLLALRAALEATGEAAGSVSSVLDDVWPREPVGDVPGQGGVTEPAAAPLCGVVMATCRNEPDHPGDHWHPRVALEATGEEK